VSSTSGREARLVDDTGETFADLSPVSREPWNEVAVSPAGHVFVSCTGFDFPEDGADEIAAGSGKR
jgi:hypothetical protein